MTGKTMGSRSPLTTEDRAKIAAICERHSVVRLDVFGSAATGEGFDPGRSDVDFAVVYEAGFTPRLAEFFALRDALAIAVGRPADLVMTNSLRNPFVTAAIEASRETLYGTR